MKKYCEDVSAEGYSPAVPYLPFAEDAEDKRAEAAALELLSRCKGLWVYGAEKGLSRGMQEQIVFASKHGIPIYFRDCKKKPKEIPAESTKTEKPEKKASKEPVITRAKKDPEEEI